MSPKAQMIAPVFVAGILSCRTARVMPPLPPQSNVGTTSEADEQERITSTLLQRPELANRVRNQRVVPIRFSMGPAAKDDNAKVIATVVFFNYDEGQAFRVQADRDGAVLAVEELKGRPAASVAEIDEAKRLVHSDPLLSIAFAAGGILEGGIIVDAPESLRANRGRHRLMQMLVLTQDRKQVEYNVLVDLTDRSIPIRQKPEH